jgi:hypothetical protein
VSIDPARRPGDVGEFWGMLKNAVSRDLEARGSFGYSGAPGMAGARPGGALPKAVTPQPSRVGEQEAGRYHYSAPPPPVKTTSSVPPPPKEVVSPFGATAEQMRAPPVPDLAIPTGSDRPPPAPVGPPIPSEPPAMEVAYAAREGGQTAGAGVGAAGQTTAAAHAAVQRVAQKRAKNSVPLVVAFAVAITVLLVGVALVVNEFTR